MSASNDLDGVMKFLTRGEWGDCFHEVLDEHFGPVMRAADMEFEEISESLGDHWSTIALACAFEDFLTCEFEVAGVNIVDDYLKRRGWKESAQSKAYLKALRNSVMSLYEVSSIVPGASLMARDLVRGGEPVAVSEATASMTLKQWDRVAARIVPVAGKNVFAGGLLPFTPEATEVLFEGLRRTAGKKSAGKPPLVASDDLQGLASIFTLSWLSAMLRPARLSVRNSDGDEFALHEVDFPFASGVTRKAVVARLDAIPEMSRKNAKCWTWFEDQPKGKAGPRQGDGISVEAMAENGMPILGDVELKGRLLHLAANSAARAERGTALIRRAFGDLLGAPSTKIRTVEDMMAEKPGRDDRKKDSANAPEIAERAVHQYLDAHYRETLDQPVGMLGNKTPRQLAKTPAGRRKVAEWLKHIENSSARHIDPADPMATYSYRWMWEELGIEDLRRCLHFLPSRRTSVLRCNS